LMEKMELQEGMLVQLNPDTCSNKMLGGCFMVVTEPKDFGAQGYIQCTGENWELGGQAYYRASWEEMELCGQAEWMIEYRGLN